MSKGSRQPAEGAERPTDSARQRAHLLGAGQLRGAGGLLPRVGAVPRV